MTAAAEYHPPEPLAVSSKKFQSAATLADALQRLLDHTAHRVRQRVRSPATLQMQRWHVAWLKRELGAELPVADVTHSLVFQLGERLAATALSPHTVGKRLSTLRRALRLCVARGELAAMPAFPEVVNPVWQPRVRILRTFAEYRRLCDALAPRRAEWVALALWTCQRPGDVERMCWGDVDLEGSPPTMRIRSTKTRRPAPITVKMPAPLVAALRVRRDRLATEGQPPGPGDRLVDSWPAVSSRLPVVCARLGLPPMSAVDLRHSGISWMVRRTGLTPAAQRWGGWSSYTMMERHYAHALPVRLVQASNELASIARERRRSPRKSGK